MSNVARVAGQAANTLTKPLNVEDVFSTYLYNGTATNVSHQIQNGIDLAGEGGLVWIKKRDSNIANTNHYLSDTERGNFYIASNSTNAQAAGDIASYNSDGWTFNASTGLGTDYLAAQSYASWTFRKAPKFFDVVTYTGTGSAQTISHNLGTTPGFIVVKGYDTAGRSWACYHRSLGYTKRLLLNYTSAEATDSTYWNAEPTDAVFSVGTQQETNLSGTTYVAYLFAHNDGDGEFGPDGDADIIKCGSFTTDSGGNASVDIGFEPQWIIYKRSDGTSNWGMNDNMRGWADTYWNPLYADASNAESGFAATRSWPTATGFEFEGQLSASANYIYIAIRRGPMAVPESATGLFAIDTFGSTGDAKEPAFRSSFPVDMAIYKSTTGTNSVNTARLIQGKSLAANTTNAEATSSFAQYDYQNGYYGGDTSTYPTYYSWMWKRAPNYFDVVAWEGSGTSGYEFVDHNLGATPEMIWFKNRDSSATPRGNWYVYHKDLANSNGYLFLNSTSAEATDYPGWATGSFPFSDTRFVVQKSRLSYSGESYIAYLFASVDGVSKVGSFTGNGSSTGDSQNIDCGFSSGARFVLVKAIGAAGAWFLFDTERGIVAGNDSHLSLNSNAAEDTSRDLIDPYSSGFTINYHSDWGNQLNGNGQTYIFYAIA